MGTDELRRPTAMNVLLTGGPHAGIRQIDGPAAQIRYPRWRPDGMVSDVYDLAARSWLDDGTPVFVYAGEAEPQPASPEVLARVAAEDQADHDRALDPGLVAYLDWPLYFPDCAHPVTCDQRASGHDCDCDGLPAGRRMTIREFLTDIRNHAEAWQR